MIFGYRIARGGCGSRIILGILKSSLIFSRAALPLFRPTVRTFVTTILPPPSNAQSQAIKVLQTSRDNILFNACAGSGKTTTILHLAAALPALDFLILVYNNRLMVETNERIRGLGLKNAVVYNYHTLGHRFYSPECDTDQGLRRIVRDKLPVMRGKKLPLCDVLVLDEQQDMTPILKIFIDKVVQDIEDIKSGEGTKSNKKGVREQGGESEAIDLSQRSSRAGKRLVRVRRVLLGDPRQELYGFNDADSRFLTLAPLKELFGNDEAWKLIKQDISYRLTKPNAEFINKQMLKPVPGREIVSIKDKAPDGSAFPKPRYVFYGPLLDDDVLAPDCIPFREVQRLLSKMNHSDILVLTPSLKNRNAIDLANNLALKGHPVHIPDFEDRQSVSLSQSRGKVTVCTYHQSKGIEREAAVLYGFDESYNRYYNKTSENPLVAGNPQYVAATRARTNLVLLNHCEYSYPPFIDPKTLGDTCEIVNREIHSPPEIEDIREVVGTSTRFTVTTLTRNIHSRDMAACISELELEQISPGRHGSSPPSEIKIGGGLMEGVVGITGTAVPAIYEYYTKGKYATYQYLSSFARLFRCFRAFENEAQGDRLGLFRRIQDDRPDINDHLRIVFQKMAARELDDGDILFLTTFSSAIESGLLVKLLSIPLDRYSWVGPEHRKNMIRVLSKHILFGCRFERDVSHTFSRFQPKVRISGRLDISELEGNKHVWEVKYTQELQVGHILQAALYAGLVEAKYGKGCTCKLINAKSGEVIGIKPKTESSYENIIQRLVDAKVTKSATLTNLTDEEFIKEAGSEFKNYIVPVVLPSWFNNQKIPRSRKSTTVKDAMKSGAKGTVNAAEEVALPS